MASRIAEFFEAPTVSCSLCRRCLACISAAVCGSVLDGPQRARQRIRPDLVEGECLHIRKTQVRELAQRVAWRHFDECPYAALVQRVVDLVPAHRVGDAEREIAGDRAAEGLDARAPIRRERNARIRDLDTLPLSCPVRAGRS
jgi:hypothetical protein